MAGPAPRPDAAGLALLLATTIGWGLNWPAMKLLLAELPVLSTRAAGGGLGFAVLLAVALALLLVSYKKGNTVRTHVLGTRRAFKLHHMNLICDCTHYTQPYYSKFRSYLM